MTKYIDADALLKAIDETPPDHIQEVEYPGYTDTIDFLGKETIIEIINEMPSADVEPVRKWIPCKKLLPKYGEIVLCLCENGGITVSCITYKNTKPGEAVWFGRHYVKAWMPLSILPKMDGGSE